MPIVNELWCKLLKDNNVIQKADLYEYTILSDEALVHWVILCKINKLKEDEAKGWPSPRKEKKGRKFGPHDSLQKLYLYVEEHKKTHKSFHPKDDQLKE